MKEDPKAKVTRPSGRPRDQSPSRKRSHSLSSDVVLTPRAQASGARSRPRTVITGNVSRNVDDVIFTDTRRVLTQSDQVAKAEALPGLLTPRRQVAPSADVPGPQPDSEMAPQVAEPEGVPGGGPDSDSDLGDFKDEDWRKYKSLDKTPYKIDSHRMELGDPGTKRCEPYLRETIWEVDKKFLMKVEGWLMIPVDRLRMSKLAPFWRQQNFCDGNMPEASSEVLAKKEWCSQTGRLRPDEVVIKNFDKHETMKFEDMPRINGEIPMYIGCDILSAFIEQMQPALWNFLLDPGNLERLKEIIEKRLTDEGKDAREFLLSRLGLIWIVYLGGYYGGIYPPLWKTDVQFEVCCDWIKKHLMPAEKHRPGIPFSDSHFDYFLEGFDPVILEHAFMKVLHPEFYTTDNLVDPITAVAAMNRVSAYEVHIAERFGKIRQKRLERNLVVYERYISYLQSCGLCDPVTTEQNHDSFRGGHMYCVLLALGKDSALMKEFLEALVLRMRCVRKADI